MPMTKTTNGSCLWWLGGWVNGRVGGPSTTLKLRTRMPTKNR